MTNKKVAIVTGGSRGIGYGVSMQLAEEGYDIAILDINAEENVKDNLVQLRSSCDLLYFRGNLGSSEDRQAFLQAVMDKYGRVDVLVNNAGVAPKVRMDLLEMTEESFDFVMDINLKGTFFLTQAVAREMQKAASNDPSVHPVIITVSSNSEYASSANRGEYCMSKAGLGMMTKLFADRLGNEGIWVYGIRPGIIRTDMTQKVTEKYDKLIAEGILCIPRWGVPQDIANAVSALCSGKLAYCAGQVIDVDGGFHIRRL
jgi:NAD(P)-dependent dehydrogenase (short-subunit alcohol dehydrogenase family)